MTQKTKTASIALAVPIILCGSGAGADQIVQEGSLSGGKGELWHEIPIQQFDTLGGARQLNFVQLDFLTAVIGGGQGDGTGQAVHLFVQLDVHYFLDEQLLAETQALIDFVHQNQNQQAFSVFDNDTAQVIYDEARDMALWMGDDEIAMDAWSNFIVIEDPPGVVNFSAGGSVDYSVTYDYTVLEGCAADLDGDSIVGTSDLIALLGAWGTDPQGPPDFDGDGNVGTSDLIELLGNWGPCPK